MDGLTFPCCAQAQATCESRESPRQMLASRRLLLSLPLGRMDTRVWLFWKNGGGDLTSYSGNHTVVYPLPKCDSHRWAPAHSHMCARTHTHTHRETTCTQSTPYATLYSCQRFPLNESTFTHCSFVNDLFCCCLLLNLYINRESVVHS